MADVTPNPSPAPNPAPNPTPNPSPNPTPPWYEGKADQETIGHWDNKGWKKDDPINIALEATKAARELQRHFGVPADQLLKLPKDNADEAGWKTVYNRLGVPNEAKEYDLTAVKRADGSDLDAGLADAIRNSLMVGRTPKDRASDVARGIVKHLDGINAAEAEARAARLQADRVALQKEWGTNFEFNRLTAMQGAKRAAGSDEGAAKLIASMEQAVGYTATMEFWRKIGAGTTEDTFHDAGGGGGNPTTRAGAAARKAELESDPAWRARYLAGEGKAVQELNNLMLQIHGDAA